MRGRPCVSFSLGFPSIFFSAGVRSARSAPIKKPMSPQRREIRSAYIEWAKLRSKTRYNLAASDVLAVPLADLHARIEELEIPGPDGYGYKPLLEKLSAKAGVPVENIVHAQGTSMANHLAMAALLEHGD